MRLVAICPALSIALTLSALWCNTALAQLTATAGAYRVHATTDPAVIPAQGKANLRLCITDAAGKLVPGATVRALTKMPGRDMGERETVAMPTKSEGGVYTVPATFAVEGGYESNLAISGSLGNKTARLSLQTGQNTAQTAADSFPWQWIVDGLLTVGAVVLLLRQMRCAGTMPERKITTKAHPAK